MARKGNPNYVICSPREKNGLTGNHCLSPIDFKGKDFMFKFKDGREVLVPYDTVNAYQQTHPEVWHKGVPQYDEDGNFKRYLAWVSYMLISDEWILSFAA